MSARLCVALASAAMIFTGGPKVLAADLYGENYYPPHDAQPYDDPPYAEGHGYPPPNAYRDDDDEDGDLYAERGGPYDGRDEYRYRGSTKDGYAPPPRFAERYDGRCLARWQIRNRLRGEGWVDIQPLERREDAALLRARRAESGRVFTLRVDRCSGEIVNARPHYLRAFGAYAPTPWRRGYTY